MARKGECVFTERSICVAHMLHLPPFLLRMVAWQFLLNLSLSYSFINRTSTTSVHSFLLAFLFVRFYPFGQIAEHVPANERIEIAR